MNKQKCLRLDLEAFKFHRDPTEGSIYRNEISAIVLS